MYFKCQILLLNLLLKLKLNSMKNLLVLLAISGTLMFCGCSENPIEPVKIVNQTDVEIQGVSYPTIQVISNGTQYTYKYEYISYENGYLEIQLANCQGGGCGISIEFSSITYLKTFK